MSYRDMDQPFIRTQQARKTHMCYSCGAVILKGKWYERLSLPPRSELGNLKWVSIKVCLKNEHKDKF